MADRGHLCSASRQRLLLLLAGSRGGHSPRSFAPRLLLSDGGRTWEAAVHLKPSKARRTGGGVRVINEATCTHRH